MFTAMDNINAIAKQVAHALKLGEHKLGIAESCTGGIIATELSAISGASEWFDFGIICYSNNSKRSLLAVSAATLEQHSAVSEETAVAMCAGAIELGASCALSVTGIAGPDGGTAEKPVGMVCFGWLGTNFPQETDTQYFSGERQDIRQQAATHALIRLLTLL